MRLTFRTEAVPGRYKYGFLLGGVSLAALLMLLATSRSTDATLAETALPSLVTRGTFSQGLTLYDALTRVSVPPRIVQQVGSLMQRAVDPRSLKNTDVYEIVQSPDSVFQRLVLTRGLWQYVVSTDESSGLRIETREIPLTPEERIRGGTLTGSLWESMRALGLSPELVMQFADIFAWNLDFLTESRKGDRFALLWEDHLLPDGKISDHRIQAALYTGRATGRHLAVLFNGDYYDDAGDSVRKAFLHAPLNFRRISSGFTQRRFHPILRYFRPHLGIDYAAPRGTPAVSVGDGTVIFRGWKPMYGNFVQVRHNGATTTCYAHFSRIARGLRRGSRVRQGQVIGYVGSTGHATGPHLDFRVIQNGRFVNFLKLKFPADKKIPAAKRPEFEDLLRRRLDVLEEAVS